MHVNLHSFWNTSSLKNKIMTLHPSLFLWDVSTMTFPTLLRLFQMDLWSCPSSSSSPPRGSWSSVGTACLCSAPPPTWISRWRCSGFTMATLWPRWRTEASTWRRPFFMTAACWPGTYRAEGKKYELRAFCSHIVHSSFTCAEIHRLESIFVPIRFFFFLNCTFNWSNKAHRNRLHSLFVKTCSLEKQLSETVPHRSRNLALFGSRNKHMKRQSGTGLAARQHLSAARLRRSSACSRSQQSVSADYTRWQEQMPNHNRADKARTAASRICQTEEPPNPSWLWIPKMDLCVWVCVFK